MSRGSFNYAYSRVLEFSEDLGDRLNIAEGITSGDGEEYPNFSPEVMALLREIVDLTHDCAQFMKAAEQLYSSDIGDDIFVERIQEIIRWEK